MGNITKEVKYELQTYIDEQERMHNINAYVLYDEGCHTQYGYEIELSVASGYFEDDENVLCVSFGYEKWSRELWLLFGDALSDYLEVYEKNGSIAFNQAIDELIKENIDCTYMCFQKDDEQAKEKHMCDIYAIIHIIRMFYPSEIDQLLKKWPIETIIQWNNEPKEDS